MSQDKKNLKRAAILRSAMILNQTNQSIMARDLKLTEGAIRKFVYGQIKNTKRYDQWVLEHLGQEVLENIQKVS